MNNAAALPTPIKHTISTRRRPVSTLLPLTILAALLAALVVVAAVTVLPATAQEAQPPTAKALLEQARKVITDASLGPDPALRSNAIESAALEPSRALPLVTRGLTDPNAGVRFAAVVTAGRLQFNQLAEAIRPLTNDPNRSVQAAALFALHRTGDPIDISPLAKMLSDPDPRLRSNVALLLGLLGDETAIPMLKQAAQAPMHRSVSFEQAAVVRIQIAEAIARLDETTFPDDLEAGAYSPVGEVQVLAINALGSIQDRRMERALAEFLKNPPVEIQIAAAAALARLDNPIGLPVAIQQSSHEQPVVRAQAAWALGWFPPSNETQAPLSRLLSDDSPQVRVSSAASIIRQNTPVRTNF